jgi:phage baseplate assembly protein W
MNIDYPLHFNSRGRTANTGENDHVRDMIEQLLLTSPGERVNRPDFGSGLQQMVFAPNRVEIAATVQFTLEAAIERWLGNVIELRNLNVDVVDTTLTITVEYALRRTGEIIIDTFTRGAQ